MPNPAPKKAQMFFQAMKPAAVSETEHRTLLSTE